ncbi:hypothetical protein N9H90_07305 [Pseudomonadales bacterium]|nr:hypothetical protein [Pseudomonadales bacterium]
MGFANPRLRTASFYIGDPFMQIGGSHSVNHMDIGPRHAGTLMGITNAAGTILGIVGVSVTGLIPVLGHWCFRSPRV